MLPEPLGELCRLGASWHHGVAICPNEQIAERASELLWGWGYTLEELESVPPVVPLTRDEMMVASDAIDRARSFEGLERSFGGS